MTAAIHATQTLAKQAGQPDQLTKTKSGGISSLLGGDIGRVLLMAGVGAAAGAFIPVIPGGPVGGALIGAALALLL